MQVSVSISLPQQVTGSPDPQDLSPQIAASPGVTYATTPGQASGYPAVEGGPSFTSREERFGQQLPVQQHLQGQGLTAAPHRGHHFGGQPPAVTGQDRRWPGRPLPQAGQQRPVTRVTEDGSGQSCQTGPEQPEGQQFRRPPSLQHPPPPPPQSVREPDRHRHGHVVPGLEVLQYNRSASHQQTRFGQQSPADRGTGEIRQEQGQTVPSAQQHNQSPPTHQHRLLPQPPVEHVIRKDIRQYNPVVPGSPQLQYHHSNAHQHHSFNQPPAPNQAVIGQDNYQHSQVAGRPAVQQYSQSYAHQEHHFTQQLPRDQRTVQDGYHHSRVVHEPTTQQYSHVSPRQQRDFACQSGREQEPGQVSRHWTRPPGPLAPQPARQQYNPPPAHQQYNPPPAHQQYNPPPAHQQYNPPPARQQYNHPPAHQQYNPPPARQQYNPPPAHQQYNPPPARQQYNPPPAHHPGGLSQHHPPPGQVGEDSSRSHSHTYPRLGPGPPVQYVIRQQQHHHHQHQRLHRQYNHPHNQQDSHYNHPHNPQDSHYNHPHNQQDSRYNHPHNQQDSRYNHPHSQQYIQHNHPQSQAGQQISTGQTTRQDRSLPQHQGSQPGSHRRTPPLQFIQSHPQQRLSDSQDTRQTGDYSQPGDRFKSQTSPGIQNIEHSKTFVVNGSTAKSNQQLVPPSTKQDAQNDLKASFSQQSSVKTGDINPTRGSGHSSPRRLTAYSEPARVDSKPSAEYHHPFHPASRIEESPGGHQLTSARIPGDTSDYVSDTNSHRSRQESGPHSDSRPHDAHQPSNQLTNACSNKHTSSTGYNQSLGQHQIDAQRMAIPFAADYANRTRLIQQIQFKQQQRATSSPFHEEEPKKPEGLQPIYPSKDTTSFQPPGEDPYLSYINRPGQNKLFTTLSSEQPVTMTDSSKVKDNSAFLRQSRLDVYKTNSYGGQVRNGPYSGDGYYDGLNDPFGKLNVAEPKGYPREPNRTEGDPFLSHLRHGSLTDDDKMNETGQDESQEMTEREMKRRLEQLAQVNGGQADTVLDEAEVMSEEEIERRLEQLRQMHDEQLEKSQNQAEHRTDAKRDVDALLERALNGNSHPEEFNSSDTGSATPTNGHDLGKSDPARSNINNASHSRKGNQGPQHFHGELVPVSADPQQVQPQNPQTLPSGDRMYYPRTQHHVSQPSSEPAYSRNASPGPDEQFRAQSQPYLRLIHDSYDPSFDSSHNGDNPGVTFDRYARRATRASVLNKAEQLLNSRKQSKLESISEMNRDPSAGRLKKKPPRPPDRRRKVAFIQQQEEEEEEESGESDHSKEEDFQTSVALFQAGGSKGRGDRRTLKNSRLQQVNARMKKRSVVVPRSIPLRRLAQQKKRHRRQRTKRKFINAVRAAARMSLRRRNIQRGKGYKVARGRVVHDDLDQFSSASEEEEDVIRYGPAAYDDLSRYELGRGAYKPLSPERSLEQEQQEPNRKARRVWFFLNGDPNAKPRQGLISQKNYPNFERLLVDLSEKFPNAESVRYIFRWPDRKEIKSVTEFENGCYYLCSKNKQVLSANYGSSREQYWRGGKPQRKENFLFTDKNPSQVPSPPGRQKPTLLTVVSNVNRESQEKVLLNTSTTQTFEDFLGDLHNLVDVVRPPARALYTFHKPRVKVEGFSHLFRLLKDHHHTFLVCGEEGVPQDPEKRALPSSDSSNGSVHSKASHRHTKVSKGGLASFRSGDASPNRRLALNRTGEPIRFEINGRKREFYAPSSVLHTDSDGKKPHKKFRLNWVYGYRGRDVRQNLVVLPETEELVYFVASVVVLYDREKHAQRHYMGHTDEITCLALHPSEPFIASGQVAGKTPEAAAHVRVWNALNLTIISVLGVGAFQGRVTCVSFSEREDLLLAIDNSDHHVMSLWNCSQDQDRPLAHTRLVPYGRVPAFNYKTTQEPVVYGCFFPFNETILVTLGRQHLYFWKVFIDRQDGPIRRDTKSGIFELQKLGKLSELKETPKFVTSVCFSPRGDVITGDSKGSVTVWTPDEEDIFRIDQEASEPMISAHKKSVSSLVLLPDQVLLSGGGSEIKAWDARRGFLNIIERQLPQAHGAVRKIIPLYNGGVDSLLLVGTVRNVVLEGSLRSRFNVLIQGHSEELWAVKPHPLERSFFTAGHDRTLVKWSALNHHPSWVNRATAPCSSLAVDPRGAVLAVGTVNGDLTLYRGADGQQWRTVRAFKAQINALAFSPDGQLLAAGCQDGFVYVCTIQEDKSLHRLRSAQLRPGTFVMHLDWSTDGRYLQTVLGDYDVVFWDVKNMTKVQTMTYLRDVFWQTHSSPVGYDLAGPWRKLRRGEVLNVSCRSKDLDLIVTGDNLGRVRLFKYPATAQQPDCQQVKPFSSHVTAVEFLYGDSGVVVSGGADAVLMQYDLLDR